MGSMRCGYVLEGVMDSTGEDKVLVAHAGEGVAFNARAFFRTLFYIRSIPRTLILLQAVGGWD